MKKGLLLVLMLLPLVASAHDFEVDGIFYNINGEEATVTFKGSYSNEFSDEYSGDVVIPDRVTYNGVTYAVTAIGDAAFYGCSELTSIEIPNSVTSIGTSAFEGTAWYNNQPDGLVYAGHVAYKYKGSMPNNASITLNEGTTGIANLAFDSCFGLTSITFPNSVTSIGLGAFANCNGLTSIDIPNSLATIGSCAFYCCTGLTSMTIPNSVTTIEFATFSGCRELTNINIGNSIAIIGANAFESCSRLNSINLPNSVTTIGAMAFDGCTSLTSINIPNSVTTIGCHAFINCARLTNVTIPNSVTTINDCTFAGCTALAKIDIPNSVTTIGDAAFYGCSELTSIEIPNSVITIGESAFYGCNGLTRIDIGNSVATIGGSAFSGCSGLTDVFCYATNPPECLESTFSPYSPTLHVPASSLAAYFTAPYWSNFENIMGDAVIPTAISITKDSVDLQLAEQINLTATVSPANASNKVVNWHSTNKNIAIVDNGIVTAVGIGECDIVATCFGMNDTCHVTVGNQLNLDQQEALLLPNHMLILTPTAAVLPNGFTATSSEPTVAAVRVMNGKVQVVGIKEGLTTITVYAADGIATPANCLVTVYTKPGDMNSDGFLTITDMTSLIDYLMGGDPSSITTKNADVNGDGKISITDVTSMIDALLNGEE